MFFRVLQGTGAASLGALNATLVGDIYPNEERSKVMGYVASVLSIGTASYPAIGGGLALLGWYYPFLLPLLALPVAWAVLFKLDNPEPKREDNLGEYLKEALKNIKSKEVIILFVSSFIVFVMLFGAYLTYLPLLMDDKFQSSSFEIGLILTTMSVTTSITSAMLGKINKYLSERRMILLGFTAYAIAFFMILFIGSFLMLLLPVIIFGIGHGMNFPSIQSHLTKVAPLKYRGMFMSFNGMVLRIGQTTGPLIIGWFFTLGSHLWAFWGAALLAVVMLIVLFISLKI